MQENAEFLTTAEAATYLRLKERKLYELVSQGAIPCTKVTGRWLFPKAELDRWLAGGMTAPDGLAPAEPMPIIGGSHDPLLEWALRESGSALATLPEGSEAGLARFSTGEVVAAAIHLHALDDAHADTNVDTLRRGGGPRDAVLIGFARREQGLIVAPGNPLKLSSVADAAERSALFAMRPKGAGAQLLLLAMLHRAKIAFDSLSVVRPDCPTGNDIAQAIRAGRADCGIATRSVATAAALDFVPLTWERFDLAMRPRAFFRPPLQKLIAFLRSTAFATRAGELGGYDVTDAAERSARFAMRPKGAGAQLLLLAMLHRAKIALDSLSVVRPDCPTGNDIAQAIRAGRADCGIATRSVATAAALDFVPLTWERFDLAMRPRDFFRPPLQKLIAFLHSPAFATRAGELGGYDVTDAATVRYAP